MAGVNVVASYSFFRFLKSRVLVFKSILEIRMYNEKEVKHSKKCMV